MSNIQQSNAPGITFHASGITSHATWCTIIQCTWYSIGRYNNLMHLLQHWSQWKQAVRSMPTHNLMHLLQHWLLWKQAVRSMPTHFDPPMMLHTCVPLQKPPFAAALACSMLIIQTGHMQAVRACTPFRGSCSAEAHAPETQPPCLKSAAGDGAVSLHCASPLQQPASRTVSKLTLHLTV